MKINNSYTFMFEKKIYTARYNGSYYNNVMKQVYINFRIELGHYISMPLNEFFLLT